MRAVTQFRGGSPPCIHQHLPFASHWPNARSASSRYCIDRCTALIDQFPAAIRNPIATEAAAGAWSPQFCSLVVNYDLEPQRVEQRIGRIATAAASGSM